MKGGKKREEGGPLVWPVIVIDSGANCSIATDSMYVHGEREEGEQLEEEEKERGEGGDYSIEP